MKWVFLLFLLIFTPALSAWLRGNREQLKWVVFALGLTAFLSQMFNITASPVTWPAWQGHVKGYDIGLVDALAIGIIFGLSGNAKVIVPWRLRISFAIVLVAYVVATMLSDNKMASSFYGWQLLRCIIIFYAVAKATLADRRSVGWLFAGATAGLAIEAFQTSRQYLSGITQAPGSFGHQNLLGMVSNSVALPVIAAFIGGFWRRTGMIALVAAIIIAFTGGSRATVGMLLVGMVVAFGLAAMRGMTARKWKLAGIGLLALGAVSVALVAAIERRPAEVRAGSSAMREDMEEAAMMIHRDYPMGIGANQYVSVANVGGYIQRAGINWTSAAALVHNTYYLVLSELGPLGVLGFVSVIVSMLSLAWQNVRRLADDEFAYYNAGIAAALVAIAAHSWVEWVTMSYPVHFWLAAILGLIAASRQLEREMPKQPTRRARQSRPLLQAR